MLTETFLMYISINRTNYLGIIDSFIPVIIKEHLLIAIEMISVLMTVVLR